MTTYYYSDDGSAPKGPINAERLKAMYVLESISGTTPVIEVGASSWKTYDELFGAQASNTVAAAVPGAAAYERPSVPQPPARAVAQSKPQKKFYYADANNEPVGPVTRAEILGLKARDVVNGDTQVLEEGSAAWVPLRTAISPVDTAEIDAALRATATQVKGVLRNSAWQVDRLVSESKRKGIAAREQRAASGGAAGAGKQRGTKRFYSGLLLAALAFLILQIRVYPMLREVDSSFMGQLAQWGGAQDPRVGVLQSAEFFLWIVTLLALAIALWGWKRRRET